MSMALAAANLSSAASRASGARPRLTRSRLTSGASACAALSMLTGRCTLTSATVTVDSTSWDALTSGAGRASCVIARRLEARAIAMMLCFTASSCQQPVTRRDRTIGAAPLPLGTAPLPPRYRCSASAKRRVLACRTDVYRPPVRAHSTMAVLVDRRRVLQRIRRSAVPLIALVAPAGYGKSYIAHRIAREDPHWTSVDASAVPTLPEFLEALSAVAVLAPHARSGLADLIDGWRRFAEPITLVFDCLEHATDPGVLEAIAALVRARPRQGKLILCARRALPVRLSDLAAPHLVAPRRAADP